MGQLVDGVWQKDWYKPDEKGAFVRPKTRFRSRISAADGPFAAEAGRYHLYASYACPWAHRALITRAVRGLQDAVSLTIVDPKMSDEGWSFDAADPDPIHGAKLLREIYLKADSKYSGRVTVPVLWDKTAGTIVNNESREVMRMLDTELGAFASGPCLAPPNLVPAIDAVLDDIYAPINNGVYRAGFATKQEAYEQACTELFEALDRYDAILSKQRYTCGSVMTEADVALFTTCLRFDVVYYAHFKCNRRRMQDYKNLWGFVRDMYQTPSIKETCHTGHIKVHYYWSQTSVNPHRIVPLGPTLDLEAPHDRARLAT